MCEMRGGVAHPDRMRHAQTFQHFGLFLHRIGGGRAIVKRQIDQCRGHIFDGLKAHVIGRSGQHPVQHVLWHRRACDCMSGKLGQHRGHFQPMLVQLARQFDEISGDRGATDRLISHIRQHLVQSMAELVKQGAGIVIGQQRRFPRRRLGKIAHIDHMRRNLARQALLALQGRTPGA